MEHLEDNVINNGVTGARESIKFLQSLRNMLSGDSNQAVNCDWEEHHKKSDESVENR